MAALLATNLDPPRADLVVVRRVLCDPGGDGSVGEQLQRDYFGLGRLAWTDDGTIEFALPSFARTRQVSRSLEKMR